MSSEITPSTARNRYWRPTAPACQIFQVLYVRPSVVWTMESSILRRRPVKPSLDDLSIVLGGYRQWFLALSTPGHGRSFWTNWRCINFLLLYQIIIITFGNKYEISSLLLVLKVKQQNLNKLLEMMMAI